MAKLNCWEFKKCGREPGGINAAELGVCPAATEERVDGMNGGKNAGRLCWAIAGTLCMGKVKGTFASHLKTCPDCDFLKIVAEEQKLNPD